MSVGILIGEDIYLFEPELLLCCLTQAGGNCAWRGKIRCIRHATSERFRFDCLWSKADIQQSIALLNVTPEGRLRMKMFQDGLTGDRRMHVRGCRHIGGKD